MTAWLAKILTGVFANLFGKVSGFLIKLWKRDQEYKKIDRDIASELEAVTLAKERLIFIKNVINLAGELVTEDMKAKLETAEEELRLANRNLSNDFFR